MLLLDFLRVFASLCLRVEYFDLLNKSVTSKPSLKSKLFNMKTRRGKGTKKIFKKLPLH